MKLYILRMCWNIYCNLSVKIVKRSESSKALNLSPLVTKNRAGGLKFDILAPHWSVIGGHVEDTPYQQPEQIHIGLGKSGGGYMLGLRLFDEKDVYLPTQMGSLVGTCTGKYTLGVAPSQ